MEGKIDPQVFLLFVYMAFSPNSGSVLPKCLLRPTRKRYACAWTCTNNGIGPVMIWKRNSVLPNRTNPVIGTLAIATITFIDPWSWI